jgi:hypothetical protein
MTLPLSLKRYPNKNSWIVDSTGFQVAEVNRFAASYGNKQDERNALDIIGAVNSHAVLYTMLARLEDALRRLPELPKTISLLDMEQTRAALAQAEEGTK